VKERTDPQIVAREVLGAARVDVRVSREVRVTVEDAFVAMVRADERTLAREESGRAA